MKKGIQLGNSCHKQNINRCIYLNYIPISRNIAFHNVSRTQGHYKSHFIVLEPPPDVTSAQQESQEIFTTPNEPDEPVTDSHNEETEEEPIRIDSEASQVSHINEGSEKETRPVNGKFSRR